MQVDGATGKYNTQVNAATGKCNIQVNLTNLLLELSYSMVN